MPVIPLGLGSYKRTEAFVPEVILRNMYLEADKSGISPDNTLRVQRPGLVKVATLPARARSVHYRTSTDERLTVAGNSLYSGQANKGAISGTGMAPMASTPFASVIVGGTSAYLYTDTLAPLPLPSDSPSGNVVQDVDQLNGYAILLQPNGRFYWLVPGDSTIEPLNFATAESLPDKAIAVRRLVDEFWIFGQQNVEVWQATGDLDAPFQRAAGRNFERGCRYRDAIRRFDNTLVWIGDDCQVYRASSVPQVISDPGIAERIRGATGECSAWTFGLDGHSFYVLTIPGQGTYAYDASTQAWSEFTWPVADGYQVNGDTVAVSSTDGRVFAVQASAPTDDGVVFERAVSATLFISGKPQRNDSITIGVGSSADTTIRVRWKDGQAPYPAFYEELTALAPYDLPDLYRLGAPQQPYRTLEVSSVAPEQVRFAGLLANESWK